MPTLRAAALTDIGRVRRENEDRFVCDANARLFGVADGVGGLPGGAEAAKLAITEVRNAFRAIAAGEEPNLTKIVQHANTSVAHLGVKLSPAMGIGTTLSFGYCNGSSFKLAHVGDSRCYLWHAGEFVQLTEDHSVENEARLRRARGEVIYYNEAHRHALTRCIGQPGKVDVDLVTRKLVAGDRYLFCTDGLTRLVSDQELAALVAKHAEPAEGLKEMVSLAVTRGGPDNVTGVLVYIDAA